MAPLLDRLGLLGARDDGCPSGYHLSGGYCYSGWSYYGRWVLAALVILCVLAMFFTACLRSRRRRRAGAQPMYGTGWMAPPGHYNNNNPAAYNQQQPPPPAYAGQAYPMQNQQPQYTGTTFNREDGYYGQHEGVASTQPKDDYAPPPGPPPAKVH